MRIDDQARECVSFLYSYGGTDSSGRHNYKVEGTAFWIAIGRAGDLGQTYLVTARHVLDATRRKGQLFVRAPDSSNKQPMLRIPRADEWTMHPTADVAVIPLSPGDKGMTVRLLPTSLFATDEWIEENDVGIGDHVVTPGVFGHYLGTRRDEPLVRFGRISLIPGERVRLRSDRRLPEVTMNVILADLDSWPGQSGSPVFVYFSVDRDLFAGSQLRSRIPSPRLLGIIHGHYNVPAPVQEKGEEFVGAEVNLNSRMAIIMPASLILEAVETDPLFREHRQSKVGDERTGTAEDRMRK